MKHAQGLLQEAVPGRLDHPHVERGVQTGQQPDIEGLGARPVKVVEDSLELDEVIGSGPPGRPPGGGLLQNDPHREQLLGRDSLLEQALPHNVPGGRGHEHALSTADDEQPLCLKQPECLTQRWAADTQLGSEVTFRRQPISRGQPVCGDVGLDQRPDAALEREVVGHGRPPRLTDRDWLCHARAPA